MSGGHKMMKRRSSRNRVPNSPTGMVSVEGTGWSGLVGANDQTALVIRSAQESVPEQSV